jgi:hypothetical protein
MTIKQAVAFAIASGMTTFNIHHYAYQGKVYTQTADTIYDFIKGYEDDDVVTVYFGTAYSQYNKDTDSRVYLRPTHCHIIYKLKNENLPTE